MANTVIRIGIIQRSLPRRRRDEQRDPGLDGSGLHRDADEPADDEDEQCDVDRPEQSAAVEDVDVARRWILDAVQAVDRRVERVDEDPLRIRVDLMVRVGDRFPVGVEVVLPGRDDPGRRQP